MQLDSRWMHLGLAFWLLMTAVVSTRAVLQPGRQNVSPVWRNAGHDWRTGHDLYGEGLAEHWLRFGYRYSPLVAALFSPLDLLPEGAGDVLVRVVNAAGFLAGLWWWLRKGVPWELTPGMCGLILLLTGPIALASLNNGQFNLLMIGLLLGCLAALADQRWNLSALFAALAILLKLYPMALVLLLVLLHPRRFGGPLVLALLALCALPYLMQSPTYVTRQYGLWWQRLRHADEYRRYWPLTATYRDIWLLCRIWAVPISLKEYSLVQIGGAGCCALLTGLARWRLGASRLTLFIALALASSWMLLLGPSPESCTYVVIAPVLVCWMLCARTEAPVLHYLAVQGYGLLVWCVVTGSSLTGIQLYQNAGLQPLAVLCFLFGFTLHMVLRVCQGQNQAQNATVAVTRSVRGAA